MFFGWITQYRLNAIIIFICVTIESQWFKLDKRKWKRKRERDRRSDKSEIILSSIFVDNGNSRNNVFHGWIILSFVTIYSCYIMYIMCIYMCVCVWMNFWLMAVGCCCCCCWWKYLHIIIGTKISRFLLNWTIYIYCSLQILFHCFFLAFGFLFSLYFFIVDFQKKKKKKF